MAVRLRSCSASTVESGCIEAGGFGTRRGCPVWVEVAVHWNSAIMGEHQSRGVAARVSIPADNFETRPLRMLSVALTLTGEFRGGLGGW